MSIQYNNLLYRTVSHPFRNSTYEACRKEFSNLTYRERVSVVHHEEMFTEFYGPLSFPLTDTRQTTLARLKDSEILKCLASVLKSDVPLFALLPTFIGVTRICAAFGVKCVVERDGYVQCLTCLAQDCHCTVFSFSYIPIIECKCLEFICSCEILPPPILYLDELRELFYLQAPEDYAFICVVDDGGEHVMTYGDEDIDDVLVHHMSICPFGPAAIIAMLVQKYWASEFRPP